MDRMTYFEHGKNRLMFEGTEYSNAFVDRLASYEDTNLTPEEIESAFSEKTVIDGAEKLLGVKVDRLHVLADADRDGRVVVLPCPFYSEVYALAQVGKEIIHGELRSTNKDYCLIVNLEGNLTSKGKTWNGVQVRMEDVFFTREAAEAALEARK